MEFLDTMNSDGWQNVMTRAGIVGQDKRVSTEYVAQPILTKSELSAMYRGDGIATKVVDIPISDMVRNWFTIEGDSDNKIVKALDKIKTRQAVKEAKQWARLYGGSLLLMGIDDGQRSRGGKELERPLREGSIKELRFYRVYTKNQVSWTSDDIDTDAGSDNYGQPKLYTIQPITENSSLQFKVHYTRVIKFIGKPLPEEEASTVGYWGDSALQSSYTRLRGFANSLIATESILDEFIIGVMTIENLQDLISGGQEDLIMKRLQQIDMSKHILNTMLVDKEENYERVAARVNGIKDILEFFKDVVSASSGIPQIKLFGEQSKGLGSQAAGNIRMYYDDISEKQEEELRPALERIVKILLLSSEFNEDVNDEWHLTFNPLWQPSSSELAEEKLNIAKSDDIYIKTNVLTAEEVAQSRFGGETYSTDTILNEEGDKRRKKALEEPINPVKEVKNGNNVEEDDSSSGSGEDQE